MIFIAFRAADSALTAVPVVTLFVHTTHFAADSALTAVPVVTFIAFRVATSALAAVPVVNRFAAMDALAVIADKVPSLSAF
jgi:hypothetical protein